jgi:hypothetical protein
LYLVALVSASSQLLHRLYRLMAMESEHGEFSIYSIGRRVGSNTMCSVPFWCGFLISTCAIDHRSKPFYPPT